VTFERAWVLLFTLLPAAWAAWEWRTSPRRLGLALKAASLVLIVLALAEPRLAVEETKTAVAVLVDTSASASAEDLARASRWVDQAARARGRNWMQVLPFARATRALNPGEGPGNWQFRPTAGLAGRSTDLEAAIREGVAALPSGLVPRLAILSDGRENSGSLARAAWQARQLGIPVDVVPMAGRPQPRLSLESVSLPGIAFSGERFPVDLVVKAPEARAGFLEIAVEGRPLGGNTVAIEAGENRIRGYAAVNTAGAVDLTVTLRAGDLGEVRFDQAITLRRPRVLYHSQDPAGTEKNLLEALTAAQFEVRAASEPGADKLSSYQIVVFNNWDLEAIPPARKDELESYVRQGGGLLVIGGERNVYPQEKKSEDPLDRTLPAKVAPPRSPEGTCVVLILDKSSSMEGRKMELARLAAIGVVQNLRPTDLLGVLIFDNSFQWAVPIRRAEDKVLLKRIVAGITPDGGTQIAPALSEAYRKIQAAPATYKHIVLLTDGISEEGDSLDLAKEALQKRVTISTVGLGQDVNKSYLEKIAAYSLGKSYMLTDPAGLEQILLRDVMEHTGSTAVEKPLPPLVARQAEILEGVAMETAPPLKGYVKFIAKPTAETILKIDRDDPLLARWQYGLGRAAVFTSDAKSRWAADWVAWKGFDRFWTNLFRDLLPHAQAGEATLEFDAADGNLVASYRLAPGVAAPARIPQLFAFGPDGFRRPIEVRKTGEGQYRGTLHIGDRQGLFLVRPLEESAAFPETGLYRPEPELQDFGANETALRQIADFTGGRFRPAPGDLFRGDGRTVPSTLSLWPGLLGLAILANLVELVLRKWRGILGRN
jgi:uncharacterized membrane protein